MRYGECLKFLFLLLVLGCASQGKTLAPDEARLSSEEPYFLDAPDLQKARVQEFLGLHPSPTEEDKIHFLLDSVARSKKKFIRNGVEHHSFKAAHWLRWKRHHKQFRDQPIQTAQSFIDQVASYSKHSGRPYQIILKKGTVRPLGEVLQHELGALDRAIEKHEAPLQAPRESKLEPQDSFKNSHPLPQVMTRAAARAS